MQPHFSNLLSIAKTSPAGGNIACIAPFTGEEFVQLPQSTIADVDAAFKRAREAQQSWATLSVRERSRVLLKFHDAVLARRDEALDIVQLETGKARAHAAEEWLDVAINARYYGRIAPKILRPRRRRGALPIVVGTLEFRHPKGVVGIVSPWNYPLTMAISDALPALVAGNAVVLRPDNKTALSALWSVSLLHACGVPSDVVQVVLGDGPSIGAAVVERGDHVMFTGSTKVGREVAQVCGSRLVSCSLELGGKNPLIVLDDANLDKAVEVTIRSSFSNTGQLCVSTERVLVHQSVMDEFLARLIAAIKALRIGAGNDWNVDVGSLISGEQLARVESRVKQAVADGGRVVVGGVSRPDLGPWFYEPTVIVDAPLDSQIWREETFGPVITVHPFSDDEEAVRLANDTEYGLNASVITRSTQRGVAMAQRIHAGTVNINEGYAAAWASVDAPMGGMKNSGLGRRHGVEGLLRATEVQNISRQRLLSFGRSFGLDHHQWISFLAFVVKAMKKVGLR